jgi:hypothetical protein
MAEKTMDTLADILRDIARQIDKGDPPVEFTETLLGLAHDVRVDHAVGQAIKYLPLSELIDVLERLNRSASRDARYSAGSRTQATAS